MPGLVAILLVSLVVGLVVWAANAAQTKRLHRFVEAFKDSAGLLVSAAGAFDPIVVTTRAPLRQARMTSTRGGKNNPGRWDFVTDLRMFAGRTTLELTHEGVLLGHLRERLGMHDVHVGDPSIDDLVCIHGSNPDAIRGVFADAAVKGAVLQLFGELAPKTWKITIDNDGTLAVRVWRDGELDPRHASNVMRDSLALADALAAASELPALPAPDESAMVSVPDEGAGASSGAPVGVPSTRTSR